MPAKWVRTKIEIPEYLKPDEREELGLRILQFIRQRSAKGLDKDNNPFPKYSPSYKNSLDFKIAGKSSKVNLKLSGDMLAALDLLNHRKGELLIGFENGTEENDRAEGNILGSYGKDPDEKKARDFLGIDPKDLAKLIKGL